MCWMRMSFLMAGETDNYIDIRRPAGGVVDHAIAMLLPRPSLAICNKTWRATDSISRVGSLVTGMVGRDVRWPDSCDLSAMKLESVLSFHSAKLHGSRISFRLWMARHAEKEQALFSCSNPREYRWCHLSGSQRRHGVRLAQEGGLRQDA